jgi:hypothetical protein
MALPAKALLLEDKWGRRELRQSELGAEEGRRVGGWPPRLGAGKQDIPECH